MPRLHATQPGRLRLRLPTLRPGWMLTLCATALSVSAWLPWLTTSTGGGGRASAIGGSVGDIALPPRFGIGQLIALFASVLIVLGALAARGLSARLAAAVAVAVSALVGVLTGWYFHDNVHPPVSAGYGFYLGAAFALGALGCSVWAWVTALRDRDEGGRSAAMTPTDRR